MTLQQDTERCSQGVKRAKDSEVEMKPINSSCIDCINELLTSIGLALVSGSL